MEREKQHRIIDMLNWIHMKDNNNEGGYVNLKILGIKTTILGNKKTCVFKIGKFKKIFYIALWKAK